MRLTLEEENQVARPRRCQYGLGCYSRTSGRHAHRSYSSSTCLQCYGRSLKKAVQDTVALDSIVRTDGWNGYSQLGATGYVHEIVREEADVSDNLLPRCNIIASFLKRWLLGTHQGVIQASHLDYYLDEFTFIFNLRTSRSRGKLFLCLAQ